MADVKEQGVDFPEQCSHNAVNAFVCGVIARCFIRGVVINHFHSVSFKELKGEDCFIYIMGRLLGVDLEWEFRVI